MSCTEFELDRWVSAQKVLCYALPVNKLLECAIAPLILKSLKVKRIHSNVRCQPGLLAIMKHGIVPDMEELRVVLCDLLSSWL